MSSQQQTTPTGNGVAKVPGAKTFVDVLRYRARTQPEAIACARIHEDRPETAWTYADLDRRARAVAGFLQKRVEPGDRVVLMFPNELDFVAAFFGCLYAGVIAVPVYPPIGDRVDRALKKLEHILASAAPKLGLTLREWVHPGGEADHPLQWSTVGDISQANGDAWQCPPVNAETLAFLQYTSGSTGEPKGVMVAHRNLTHNVDMTSQWMAIDPSSTWVSWLPLHHDMGLICVFLNSLWAGVPIHLLDPFEFMRDPYCWLAAVSRFRATHTAGPNFALELCMRRINSEQRASLDLSSLRVIGNGAEPIRAATLERFSEVFGKCGFRKEALWPGYGLAEGTLCVSAGGGGRGMRTVTRPHEDGQTGEVRPERRYVACGPVATDQSVRIVDPATLHCQSDGDVGEIWVSGPSVCEGYWRLPELSEAIFRAQLPGDDRRWLRTGDLGFFHDGELFITGRLKDLLILRGRNHYPQDIEHTVEESGGGVLRPGCSAAFAIDVGDEERLAVVAEIDPRQFLNPDDARALVERLRSAVAREHGVALHMFVLIATRTIPKTSSGKLQRRRCREELLRGGLQEIGRWELSEGDVSEPAAASPSVQGEQARVFDFASVSAALVRVLAQLTRQKQSQIDLSAPLSAFGVDSLKAVELLADLELWFGRAIDGDGIDVDMPLREIAELIIESAGASSIDADRLRTLLVEAIQRATRQAQGGIDLDAPISTFGFDPVRASDLAAEIEEALGQSLPTDSIQPGMSVRSIVAAIASR